MSDEADARLVRVCAAKVAELTGVSVGGMEPVIVPTSNGPQIFEGRCPHQGTLLSEGHVVDGRLICRAHGWQFDGSAAWRRSHSRRATSTPSTTGSRLARTQILRATS